MIRILVFLSALAMLLGCVEAAPTISNEDGGYPEVQLEN